MPDSRLVIFAHGSADSRWRLPFEELIASLAECHGVDKVRFAYMEFAQPSLSDIAQEASRDGKLPLRCPCFCPRVVMWQKTFPCRSRPFRCISRKLRSNSCSQSVSIIE